MFPVSMLMNITGGGQMWYWCRQYHSKLSLNSRIVLFLVIYFDFYGGFLVTNNPT